MRAFYTTGLYFYQLAVFIASAFNAKARLWRSGRKGLFTTLENAFREKKKTAWFHCASLGEFEQGRPLMEAFRKQHPGYRILLTFFSPSGYEVRKNYDGADVVCYLPLDTPANAKRFIAIVQPDIAFFVKYEFWYNLLRELEKRNTPHYLVSGIFRASQHFFKGYGGWFRKALKGYTYIFTQEENSLQLLKSIGVSQASVSGDTRFDRVLAIAAQAKEIPIAAAFSGERQTVFIAGSTWPADEELLAKLIAKQLSEQPGGIKKYIFAPHEIGEAHISALVQLLQKIPGLDAGHAVVRYSQTNVADAAQATVLIIDNIGMLSSLYRYGHIGYIGGGFGAGIHNTLEAAVFGMPLLFGPNYQKFNEAKGLIAAGAAVSISSADELIEKVDLFCRNDKGLEGYMERSKAFVQANGGATGKILSQISITK